MDETSLFLLLPRRVLEAFRLDIGAAFRCNLDWTCYESDMMGRSMLFLFSICLFIVVYAGVDALCKSSLGNNYQHHGKHYNQQSQWKRFSRRKRHEEDNESIADKNDESSTEKIPFISSFANALKNSYVARTSTLRKWSWEDLTFSAPFNLVIPNMDVIDENSENFLSEIMNDEEFYYDEITSKSMNKYNIDSFDRRLPNTTIITHFCFLVHGYRGMSRDLSYMQAMMRKEARSQQRKRYLQHRERIHLHRKPQLIHKTHFRRRSQSLDGVENTSTQTVESMEDPGTARTVTDVNGDFTKDMLSSSSHLSNSMEMYSSPSVVHDFVVHSVTCNEKRTDDGVKAGGERIVDEMFSFIRDYMTDGKRSGKDADRDKYDNVNDSRDELRDITISIVGNSLGGLYARYAVAEIFRCCHNCTEPNKYGSNSSSDEDSSTMILDGKYRLHWNVFCTTASPHLGLSGHTFIPLPRSAELGVALAMGETGRDLFRLNQLLRTMATDPIFLRPLSLFRKRVAYANAYGTDFPVPVSTAAFLSDGSTYPHHFSENTNADANECHNQSDKNEKADGSTNITVTSSSDKIRTAAENENNSNNLVIATLHTPVKVLNEGAVDQVSVSAGFDDQETARMSASLDSLGWKKVFVDVRKEIPRISISKSLIRRPMSTLNMKFGGGKATEWKGPSQEFIVENNKEQKEDVPGSHHRNEADLSTSFGVAEPMLSETTTKDKGLHQLKEKGVVSSRDVAAAVTPTSLLSTDSNEISIHWPLGHNMIVAFSRSRWSSYMNKAGRPVVDTLCRELVDEILSFKGNSKVDVVLD